MLVSMAGPDHAWRPGDERDDLPDAVALEWIREGIAAAVKGIDVETATVEPDETSAPKRKRK